MNSQRNGSFTLQSRYVQAIREGPARYPDHILVTHPNFQSESPSPYLLFYYDITAPNPVLLENDVIRDARLRKRNNDTTRKYWVEDPPLEYQSATSGCKQRIPASHAHPSADPTRVVPYSRSMATPSRSRSHSVRPQIASDRGVVSSESDYTFEYCSTSSSTRERRQRHSRRKARDNPSRSLSDGYTNHHSASSLSRKSNSSLSVLKSQEVERRSVSTTSNRSAQQTEYRGKMGASSSEDFSKLIVPDLRRSAKRDLKFRKADLFFDAHDVPNGPDRNHGTPFSHLPQYSTSYKNYPNIAFDVINPRNYREFFNERKAPGFFTAHRPTNHTVQGRRQEKQRN